jgi:hypothetical protein
MSGIKKFLARLIAVVGIMILALAGMKYAGIDLSTWSAFGYKLPSFIGRATVKQLLILAVITLSIGCFVDESAALGVINHASEGAAAVVGALGKGAGDVVQQTLGGLLSGLGWLIPVVLVGGYFLLRRKSSSTPVVINQPAAATA